MQTTAVSRRNKKILKIVVFTIVSAALQAFALVNFYQSSGLLSGGLTGIGLMINNLTNGAFSLATFLLVANIPLAILGYFNVGKNFTIITFVNVVISTILLTIMPPFVFLDELMLNAIVGGVIFGLGIALALEAGSSTGGTDFIALYLSVKKQKSAGQYMLWLNGAIILLSTYFFDIEIAVYTIIATYVSSKVIDSIHVRYKRVTLAIITSYGDEVINYLLENQIHGITVLPAKGGYTKEDKNFIYTVVSTYEVKKIQDDIFEIDRSAFINVTSSKEIFGKFESAKYE